MADNVTITPGSGATIATDDVIDAVFGEAQVQFVKVLDATDGSGNRLVVDNDGNANTLPNAVVNDTPESYISGAKQPLSMTPEGRLRVATYPADINEVWQYTFMSPWASESNSWETENYYY